MGTGGGGILWIVVWGTQGACGEPGLRGADAAALAGGVDPLPRAWATPGIADAIKLSKGLGKLIRPGSNRNDPGKLRHGAFGRTEKDGLAARHIHADKGQLRERGGAGRGLEADELAILSADIPGGRGRTTGQHIGRNASRVGVVHRRLNRLERGFHTRQRRDAAGEGANIGEELLGRGGHLGVGRLRVHCRQFEIEQGLVVRQTRLGLRRDRGWGLGRGRLLGRGGIRHRAGHSGYGYEGKQEEPPRTRAARGIGGHGDGGVAGCGLGGDPPVGLTGEAGINGVWNLGGQGECLLACLQGEELRALWLADDRIHKSWPTLLIAPHPTTPTPTTPPTRPRRHDQEHGRPRF